MALGSRLPNATGLPMALAVVALGVGIACAGVGGLRPFTEDGCSMFFDGTPAQRDLWRHCCYAHDTTYWRGGTRAERKATDRQVRSCVDQVEDAALAELMYLGLRAGGGPYWPTSYRWGYGWPYGRGYRPLSEDESDMAARILAESQAVPAAEAGRAMPEAHTDGWRWKFHHQNAGKRTRYASNSRGTSQNFRYRTQETPLVFPIPPI